MTPLATARLILRSPRRGDWQAIMAVLDDLAVTRHLSTVPHPYTKKDARRWIRKAIRKAKKKTEYAFVLELQGERAVIGGTELYAIDTVNRTARTGSWIARPFWGRGFTSEAKKAVNDFAFGTLGLRRLEAEAYADNARSHDMLLRLGYQWEGTRRKGAWAAATGVLHDVNIYGLLKEDWEGNN